jgi:hypothetical protein
MRVACLVLAMLPIAAAGADCTVRSGPNTNAVIELYTSEGCSSCPPADRWLSAFTAVTGTGRIVPLAFHVSYWDYIGWKDAFASARGTERQRAIQRNAGARNVYTPQVVLGGRDFPGWRSHASWSSALDAIQRKPAPVSIELATRVNPDGAIEAVVDTTGGPGLKGDDLVVLVAVTQNGLGSRVTAGENRGESLAHDFVVRDFATHRGLGKAATTFKPMPGWNPARMALAVFVQNVKSGEILQAVSAPLCRLPPQSQPGE